MEVSSSGDQDLQNNRVTILVGSLVDSDGDGVADNEDAFPEDPLETADTDNDGIGNNADSDDDGDGYSDLIL